MKRMEYTQQFRTYLPGEENAFCDPNIPFEIMPFTLGTKCVLSDIKEPHLHDYYAIQYVTEGRGTHIVDFRSYEVKAHTLFLLSPHQLHFWQSIHSINGYIVVFTEDFVVSEPSNLSNIHDLTFFHSFIQSPRLEVNATQTQMLDDVLSIISQEFATKSLGYESVLRAYLHALLVNIQRLYNEVTTKESPNSETALVRQFKHLVTTRCITDRSIQSYADKLGISISTLNATIKTVTGKTPGQILRNALIMEAKRLLANTNLTTSEVGYRLNFEDPSYFGRFFRREVGTNPTAFRKDIRQKYQLFKN